MDMFIYKEGILYCEDASVLDIANEVGTPCYIYSGSTFKNHFRNIKEAFKSLDPLVCYSVKCNSNIHICRLLAKEGSGFDIVSGGELYRAIQAGADPKKIVFAGVGKRDDEINQALDAGIGYFNIESVPELINLQKIAEDRRMVTSAALRVNPDIDPRTHRHTSTGKKHTKFGVDIEEAKDVFRKYARDRFLQLCGIHIHIGSPILSTQPYIEAISKILDLIDQLRKEGFDIEMLDIGGGFGADYTTGQAPSAFDYAADILPLLSGRGLKIILEPGRSIAANAGILVTRVIYIKESAGKLFAIVDAGMNDLIRPVLYDAFHFIWPVCTDKVPAERKPQIELPGLLEYDVVGPICETGDYFAKSRPLPPLKRGDLLAIFTAGAYGFVMSSQYNSRPRPPEILVEGRFSKLIRRRERYEDLINCEIFG